MAFVMERHACHDLIHERTIRLHHVVGQTICIVPVVMMNTQCWEQAACDETAGYHCTKNSIAIIQQGVRIIPFAVAYEALTGTKHPLPIIGCRPGLQIVRVTTAHLTSLGFQATGFDADFAEDSRLIEYFSPYRLLP